MFIFTPTTCICSLQPFIFFSVVSRVISNEIHSQIDFPINKERYIFRSTLNCVHFLCFDISKIRRLYAPKYDKRHELSFFSLFSIFFYIFVVIN